MWVQAQRSRPRFGGGVKGEGWGATDIFGVDIDGSKDNYLAIKGGAGVS
jgi:hypothetical protein